MYGFFCLNITKALSKSCFYDIRTLKHICDLLDSSMIRTIAAALVTSRLDYANSVLYGILAKYISRLQRTQNTLAHVVAGSRTPCSSLATLSQLHWLPVYDHIKFKIATMTHKAIHTGNLQCRQQWSLLNRFRVEQGHCGACRRKWQLTDTDLCPCGETQTITLSNPVPWQNWMVAYLGYTLRMRTLFRGWPIMVNDTHTRRRRRSTIIFYDGLCYNWY